jgi:hypothetical protein
MITNEIKARIFAQYWGQRYTFQTGKLSESPKFTINERAFPLDGEQAFIILKPLSAITDEDLQKIAEIEVHKPNKVTIERFEPKPNKPDIVVEIAKNERTHNIRIFRGFKEFDDADFINCDYDYDESRQLTIESFQYIQSRGYALGYMEYSVEDLVKAGIYKLEE